MLTKIVKEGEEPTPVEKIPLNPQKKREKQERTQKTVSDEPSMTKLEVAPSLPSKTKKKESSSSSVTLETNKSKKSSSSSSSSVESETPNEETSSSSSSSSGSSGNLSFQEEEIKVEQLDEFFGEIFADVPESEPAIDGYDAGTEATVEEAQETPHKYLPHGLGRVYIPDEKDKQYLLRRQTITPTRTYRYHYNRGAIDQGNSGECVGYGWWKYLEVGPIRNLDKLPTPRKIYDRAQEIDEWPGSELVEPHYEGTSVRAGAKALKEQGYIKEYNWAYDVQTIANWILEVGPMVVGTDWHWDMFDPDKKGFIYPTGPAVGGHAYLIKGVNVNKICPDGTKGAFRILNSWGEQWGEKGHAWISMRDMQKLLNNYGEACCALELLAKD